MSLVAFRVWDQVNMPPTEVIRYNLKTCSHDLTLSSVAAVVLYWLNDDKRQVIKPPVTLTKVEVKHCKLLLFIIFVEYFSR